MNQFNFSDNNLKDIKFQQWKIRANDKLYKGITVFCYEFENVKSGKTEIGRFKVNLEGANLIVKSLNVDIKPGNAIENG